MIEIPNDSSSTRRNLRLIFVKYHVTTETYFSLLAFHISGDRRGNSKVLIKSSTISSSKILELLKTQTQKLNDQK